MSTYFGYVEREADNYINWADVSKNIITTVDDINKVREEKKQALDDDYRAALKELTLQPKGKDEAANKYITEYGDNASNFLMMQNRLLKEGKLKVKDYINARQNLGDGTDNLFQIMKDYQANYGAYMEAYKNGEISAASLWNLKQVEKFADFSKSGAYIAADGSVMAAMKTMKKVNGQEIYTLDTNPGEVASLSVLKNTVNTMINRYDANKKTTDIAKSAGTYIQSMYINGQIASIEDITALEYGQDPLETTETLRNAIADLNTNEKNEFVISEDLVKRTKKTALGNETEVAQMYKSAKAKAADQLTDADKKVINFVETKLSDLIEKSKGPKFKFVEAETKMILAAMPQVEDQMSVLVDNKQFASNGLEYDFRPIDDVDKVEQLTKENPNIIYMANVNGQSVPVLSKAQKEEAVEYMRGIVRAKYTLKEVDKGTTNRYDVGQGTLPKSQTPSVEQQKLWSTNRGIMDEGMFMANLYNGNKTDINTALSHFGGDTRINSIERNEDGVYITYKDPTIKDAFIPFFNPDGTAFGTDSFLDAAKKALLYPEDFDLTVAKQGVKNKSLMPNLEEFSKVESGRFDPTPERKPGFFESKFPSLSYVFGGSRSEKIAQRTRINRQGGGSAAGGGGASAAGGKAR